MNINNIIISGENCNTQDSMDDCMIICISMYWVLYKIDLKDVNNQNEP